jgi:hypothetical protein
MTRSVRRVAVVLSVVQSLVQFVVWASTSAIVGH